MSYQRRTPIRERLRDRRNERLYAANRALRAEFGPAAFAIAEIDAGLRAKRALLEQVLGSPAVQSYEEFVGLYDERFGGQ